MPLLFDVTKCKGGMCGSMLGIEEVEMLVKSMKEVQIQVGSSKIFDMERNQNRHQDNRLVYSYTN